MFIYEYRDEILVVDCGIGFPEQGMLGVDLVVPDISYLTQNRKKILGIVLTHGHEDHVGGLSYVLPFLRCPVYGTKLTAGLAEIKLKEAGIKQKIKVIHHNQKLFLGNFNLEFIRVPHSVPDAVHLLIKTPVGNIYHGSDFKFDFTPVDGVRPEIEKITLAGKNGVDILLSDCLRSEKMGYTLSERTLYETFEREIRTCEGKFFFTTMSSNISRIKQAIEVASRYGRRICLVGRSLKQNMEVAQRLGYIALSKDLFVPLEKIKKIPSERLAFFVSGSQGQTNSALFKIAHNDHRLVKIAPRDKVVFSQDPIPGNELAVHNLIDALIDKGAEVSYSEILEDLHVSGHAAADELRMLVNLTKPRYLMPIGGTLRQMKHYEKMMTEIGFQKENIFLLKPGWSLELGENKIANLGKKISVSEVFVDGLGVGDVGRTVLRDRQILAEEGVFIVIAVIDKKKKDVVNTEIVSRGFVYVKHAEKLLFEAQELTEKVIKKYKHRARDKAFLKVKIGERLENFFYEKTERRPMILAMIVEI